MYAHWLRYGFGKLAAQPMPPPGSPALWFDAQDVNFGSAQPTDGANIATWKNKGTLGSAADALQATGSLQPFFRKVATPGKLQGLSSVQGDGTRWMKTATFTARALPCIHAVVTRTEDLASAYGYVGGPSGGNCGFYTTSPTGAIHMNATSDLTTGFILNPATYHMVVAVYNTGSAAFMRFNGTASATGTVNPQNLTALTLFGLDAGTFADNAHIVEELFYDDTTTPAQIEAYYQAKYGAFPQ